MQGMTTPSSPSSKSHVNPALHSRVVKLLGAAVACGALAAAVLLPVIGGVGLAATKVSDQFLGTPCDLVITPAQQTTTVLASDGKTVIARLFAQNRQDVPLTAIPQSVQDALISTEDRRFYSHHGVDVHGIARAALHNGGGGGATQGGSTLTMQYVKQVRYYQAATPAQRQAAIDQDLHRKIQDAKCAIDLEKRYSKKQILDDYLNIAFFGENSYGIQTAAQTYFGVPASKLTVPQGAMLVGLVQSPSQLDPFENPQGARQRRDQVLDNMVGTGSLTAAQAAKYKTQPLRLSGTKAPPVREGCANSTESIANVGFFCDYVIDWLRSQGGLSPQTVQTGGFKIVTSLDAHLQNSGQQAVWGSGLDPNSPTALVMPSVDPKTGRVQTMITSRHYGVGAGQTTVPLFTSAYAGSGSTYKYFTALAALKLGAQPDFTLTTGNNYTVHNCPVDPNSNTPPYNVSNAGSYNATLPLSDALPESVNTYFVGMEDQFFGCDLSPIVQTALGLGMTHLNDPAPNSATESVAEATISQHQTGFTLGFSSTSALELSVAYGAMANDGVFCPADPIVSVTGPTGKAVSYKKPSCSRQFSPQIARTMLNMMTTDTTSYKGTAYRYFQDWYARGGSPIPSKTGTDNDDDKLPDGGKGNSALWYVGVTPNLASAAALVNPTSPKATITGLPDNVSNNGSDVFGAYASTYWLDAYGPTLQAQSWTWPSPTDIPNAMTVPDVIGRTEAAATATLSQQGFTAAVSTVVCGSPEAPGNVGYYAPQVAAPGTRITLCLSNGIAPNGYQPRYVNPSDGYGSGGFNDGGTSNGGGTGGFNGGGNSNGGWMSSSPSSSPTGR